MRAARPFATTLLGLACAMPALCARAQGLTTLYTFTGGADGGLPANRMVYQAGMLYGTVYTGGASGMGAVFALNIATGAETTIYSFAGGTDGSEPNGGVIYDNGTLYGTTSTGGTSNLGTAFAVNASTGGETVLHSFAGQSDGSDPQDGVIYQGGALFGTTEFGGGTGCGGGGCGTVYKIGATKGKEHILHSFSDVPDGAEPTAALISAGGNLYGTTSVGGTNGLGAVFKLDAKTGAETVVYSFGSRKNDGRYPETALTYESGVLYGSTIMGGYDTAGVVFKVRAKTGAESLIYTFKGRHGDGFWPETALVYQNGLLYGTTIYGGTQGCDRYGCGTVFSVDPATRTENVLYRFTGGAKGQAPTALIYNGGKFYGTTAEGAGTGCFGSGCGTVFKFVP